MGIDHGRADVTVAEQLLDRAHVVAVLEKVNCEGVAQGVTARSLGDAGILKGFLEGPLYDGLMNMMAPAFACALVEVQPLRREHPLPGPVSAGARVLSFEGVRQGHSAQTLPEVSFVKSARPVQVPAQRFGKAGGQHGHAILWRPCPPGQ